MSLTTARTALTAHVTSVLTDVTAVIGAPPNQKPDPWTAYVWPGGPWLAASDERSMCPTADVTFVVDLLASVEDYIAAEAWFEARLTELWVGSANGVDVGGDTIEPAQTDPPVVVASIGNASFLRVRTTFSPFRWELAQP